MKTRNGWQAALEIADWLPGQDRAKAIEQIQRQRREYYRKLENNEPSEGFWQQPTEPLGRDRK